MYNDEHMEEWIMATQYAEEFKKDAVRYWKEHPELVFHPLINSTF